MSSRLAPHEILTPKQAVVLDLSESGLSQKQIAKRIGISRESVNRLLSRARKRLAAEGVHRNPRFRLVRLHEGA